MSEYDRLKQQREDIERRQQDKLEQALRNILMIARRESRQFNCDKESWEHVIRLCNEVGIEGDGVLRGGKIE